MDSYKTLIKDGNNGIEEVIESLQAINELIDDVAGKSQRSILSNYYLTSKSIDIT